MLRTVQKDDVDVVTSAHARVPVCAFVDRTVKRELEARARANDRTLSAELRVALRAHLSAVGRAG
jgi:hypothetical protein